ncbi:MAG: serine hydrolase [Candidatus Heimdallarchaeota archaeon]|nr:MAG: serine hydrolase [Candidatus Heimdallarchaeota archaeon]
MSSSKKTILVITLFCWITLALHVTRVDATPNFSKLEEKLEAIRSANNVPTVHAAITRNKKSIWTKGLGNQTAPDTVFLIASNVKPFVATALLQLYEQGIVSLDSDLSEYLPFEVRHPDYPDEKITIRMLLKHMSGLGSTLRYEFYWDTEGKYLYYPHPHYRAILNLSLGEYLNESFTSGGSNYDPGIWENKPNERYYYSNVGFKLLHYLVEYVSGHSFEDYLKENIFGPLNMTNSGINTSDFIDNHATPYSRISGKNEEMELYSTWQIRCSVTDMAHFMIAQLNNGKFGENRILKASSVDMMHSKLVQYSFHRNPLFQDVKNYKFYQHSYGLGWSHFHDGFGGHGGSTPGFLSVTAGRKNPDGTSIGIVLFMNLNSLVMNPALEDFNEVQACYNQLINTILFELNLIPTINQVVVDLLIFFATLWVTFVLIVHFSVRIVNKEKITKFYNSTGGDRSFILPFLICGLLALMLGLNYISLNDWLRLVLFLPIVSYLAFFSVFILKNKDDLAPHFRKSKERYFFQGWLVISLIGLALYNYSYWTLTESPWIPTILSLISISIIFINDITELLTRKFFHKTPSDQSRME